MSARLFITAAVAIGVLAACGNSRTDANEANFAAAMSAYIDKKGDACLGLRDWPYIVNEPQARLKIGLPVQLDALVQTGLVTVSDTTQDVKGIGGNVLSKLPAKRYEIAPKGVSYARKVEIRTVTAGGVGTNERTELCFARLTLDKVTKWEGPMSIGDYKEAKVFYTTKIEDVAPWAREPAVRAAFPVIEQLLSQAGRPKPHAVKLTSQGWEAKGLDNI